MRQLGSGKQKSIFAGKKRKEEELIAEQYRTIGTNIQFITGTKRNNIILVTSPGKGEGKSATAANIALSLAQQGNKVLLIDANFRCPEQHNIFNILNIFGFTDILDGKVTFERAITKVKGIHILTSGTIPISLSTHRAEKLLDKVKTEYSMVIIDSSPLLEINDTRILANICDGVVLVFKQNETRVEKALESKRILEYAQAKVLGVVLNEKN
ncbi:CpsD/CapB family tyrosine-protein kinase [Siminovitchia fordii]|uniref:non-specific protein-tyrosine kinase n=1 Tax=Siminovitchia fordii TaxID=254759 RepID=A0ABQ4K5E4_9BACI|nr:protein-tyrosine kinase [Siminovitchia fordii]